MNFLRRAPGQTLIGRCAVPGMEARRALAKVEITPETGDSRPICVVTGNYTLPWSAGPIALLGHPIAAPLAVIAVGSAVATAYGLVVHGAHRRYMHARAAGAHRTRAGS
jgi:hypothetical protein